MRVDSVITWDLVTEPQRVADNNKKLIQVPSNVIPHIKSTIGDAIRGAGYGED